MIGYLEGRCLELDTRRIILLVQGVGYELDISLNLYHTISAAVARDKAMLFQVWTHTLHREDSFRLFGFANRAERDEFRRLLQLPGIGTSLAMVIISSVEQATFLRAIRENRIQDLTNIPGIGKAKAERLIFEYQKKFKPGTEMSDSPAGIGASGESNSLQEARLGLISLGYEEKQVAAAVARFLKKSNGTPPLDQEPGEIVRELLRELL